jgi:signal transduction histidine kinase
MKVYANTIHKNQEKDVKTSAHFFEQFAQRLRPASGEKLSEWGEMLLQELVPFYGCFQGALYLHTEEPQKGLQLLSAYAVAASERKEFVAEREGLIGEAIFLKKTIYVESPYGFQSRARSGLVRFSPRAALLFPLVHENIKVGLLELTSLHPLSGSTRDALKEIAQSVAINLRFSLIQEEMKLRLETQVEARTKDLQNALTELQEAQDTLVRTEKMATLGQLIAGVAHEINTPIGAIKAGATNVVDILPLLLQSAHSLLPVLNKETLVLVEALFNELLQDKPPLISKEERKLRRAYIKELEALDIEDADEIADRLIEAGFISELAPYYPLLRREDVKAIIEYINLQGQVIKNMRNIILAADKTKKIVFSLKNYSYTASGDEMQPTDINALLDVVFTIFNSQFKQGVKCTANLENLPLIPTYPDELSQVFINIIQNAIHAMEGTGQILITGKVEKEKLILAFTDNGPGIPADLINKIFEPFFTTKKRGEGTGLGLDICKKIIEKHNGNLYAVSQPGETTFYIELPIK